MGPDDYLDAVREAFRAAAEGRAHSPPPGAVEAEGGTFHAKSARIALDRLYVALKFNGNFPDNRMRHGLPTVQGSILLCDGENGALLAIIDSVEVTLRRTAAATVLAAQYLARPDSRTILICGCGEQGAAHLAALRRTLPLERGFAWDRDPSRAEAFAAGAAGLPLVAVVELGAAARVSDVIVTCTTARQAFLDVAIVPDGAFVAAVGADSPDKSEIEPNLMAKALVVADTIDQCAAMGDLHHALAAGVLKPGDIHAELAELVAGARPGRTSPEQVALFDSTGTAVQDVACAATRYRRGRARGDLPVLALDCTG
jgi:ornithine cyclodeaminase/alanine dehydrogenase-like protein (mu-crystallin family)